MHSTARMQMKFDAAWSTSEYTLCRRCSDLNLLETLDAFPAWHSQNELEEAVTQRSDHVRCLGKTADIEFWDDCCVCRCLFALTPNPSSMEQDVLLFPDWSLCRVTGEFGVTMQTEEQSHYATCLVVTLDPSSVGLPLAIQAHRGDAMCLIDGDLQAGRTLGGGRLARSDINIEMVKEWISRCSTLHGTGCGPVLTEELRQVRLLDVETRRIVDFPGMDCAYVALSYVWGGIPGQSFKLGDSVGPIPRTLEDAISFTKNLGKKYLWTDYLCIDQSDKIDKAEQIGRMWSIYRGAHVTVFAMSGDSAEAGLPGLSCMARYSQMTCCIKGRRLVGTMPTFSLQSWATPWSQRAWTLQEAYLSPRCLFLTDHQMYFDCSAMLCCESLDHSRSWAHNLTPASNRTKREFFAWITDQIGAGGYRIPLRDPAKRLETWGVKLNMYSYRDLTYENDALHAFEGIAQQLRTVYPQGFYYGLPIEDFDWGLLWRSQRPPTRRKEFPSWSWAGWKGPLWFGQPFDVTQTRRFSVHLRICRFEAGKLDQIFATESMGLRHRTAGTLSDNDPVHQAAHHALDHYTPSPEQISAGERDGVLVMDAVCLEFTPDFSNPRKHLLEVGQFELFDIVVGEVPCIIHIISVDSETTKPRTGVETVVLISRDSTGNLISHHLLMLNYEQGSDVAVRATTFELLVPYDGLHALQELRPRRRRILMA